MDILGVVSNSVMFQVFPSICCCWVPLGSKGEVTPQPCRSPSPPQLGLLPPHSLLTGMLEMASWSEGWISVTVKLAFMAGSSKQGKALRASAACICVVATTLLQETPVSTRLPPLTLCLAALHPIPCPPPTWCLTHPHIHCGRTRSGRRPAPR